LRRYLRFQPITVAARAYAYIRSGDDQNRWRGDYVGYAFLVRAYDNSGRDPVGCISFHGDVGPRGVGGNFEVRLPFTGPEKLAAIKSGLLFSDLNLCFDAGLAWNDGNKIVSNVDNKPRVPQYNADGTPLLDQNGMPVYGYDRNYR